MRSSSIFYPSTENWAKAPGDHKIWGSAEINSDGDKFTMKITIHAMDRYDFNRGATDVASGTPDDENGRFATLGWAKPFLVSGSLTRVVAWNRGDMGNTIARWCRVSVAEVRRGNRMGVLLVAALALISSCSNGATDTVATQNAAKSPIRSTEQRNSDQKIRRDKQAVLKRFPQFGNIAGVEWIAKIFGRPSRMPGPTDYRIAGVAKLTKSDSNRLQREYIWISAASTPTTLDEISSKVPRNATWKVSEEFTFAVTHGTYEASFFFDPVAKVMVFDAVNPTYRG